MPLRLPTDTAHLQLETRQYELFNRPLGQGVSRRKMGVGVVVCAVWFTLLLLVGLNPVSRFGPMAYIVPPFAVVYAGTKAGDDGRMTLLRWYDALLARLPSRRQLIRNPLLSLGDYTAEPIRVDTEMTELHPGPAGEPLAPLLGHSRHRGGAS
ncbi:MAG: hypothetical protein ACRDRS_25585 [Pseudonocardiaceae bacterium]